MVRLEKFNREDYETLIAWVDSAAALMQFAGPAFGFPLTAAQLDESLSDPARTGFKVVTADHSFIGYAEIFLTATSAWLGRILIGSQEQRRKGTGLQIVHLLLEYLFSRTDTTLVQLNVFDHNTAAIRCYEKAGFRMDTHNNHTYAVDGHVWTSMRMSLDKQAWLLCQQP